MGLTGGVKSHRLSGQKSPYCEKKTSLALRVLRAYVLLYYTPCSKMAENTLFFCLHVNMLLLPRFKPNIPLNSADGVEATRAN